MVIRLHAANGQKDGDGDTLAFVRSQSLHATWYLMAAEMYSFHQASRPPAAL